MRNFPWLAGFGKGGGWGEDMKRVGGRSGSDSEFSELAEKVMDDQEARLAPAMKRGRGGAREAKSSGGGWRETSSAIAGRRKGSYVCGRCLAIWEGEGGEGGRGGEGYEKLRG